MCMKCKHFSIREGWLRCDAIPEGIPKDIIAGKFVHAEVHPDQDNDIVFEAKKKG